MVWWSHNFPSEPKVCINAMLSSIPKTSEVTTTNPTGCGVLNLTPVPGVTDNIDYIDKPIRWNWSNKKPLFATDSSSKDVNNTLLCNLLWQNPVQQICLNRTKLRRGKHQNQKLWHSKSIWVTIYRVAFTKFGQPAQTSLESSPGWKENKEMDFRCSHKMHLLQNPIPTLWSPYFLESVVSK